MILYAAQVNGELVSFPSNPTDTFKTAEEVEKAIGRLKDKKVKDAAQVIAFRCSKTVVL